MTTAPEVVVARKEEPALTHPAYGCNRIKTLPALEGWRVSAITGQKILNGKIWAAASSDGEVSKLPLVW